MLRVSIIGNLGADVKVVSGDFRKFYSLSVAHSRKFVNKQNIQVEQTYWVNVVINWDASKLAPFLLKGTKVFASGNVRLRTFKGNDGNYHAGLDIIADTVELCGSARQDTITTDEGKPVDVSTGEILNTGNEPPF